MEPIGENEAKAKFRSSNQMLAQAVINQVNREVISLASPNVNSTALRVGDFMSMNHQEFYGSIIEEEDSKEFID